MTSNAADSDDNIYSADNRNHRVKKFPTSGEFLAPFGSGGTGRSELDRPSSVAVDSDGDVYVCDWANDRVQVYGADGMFITSLIGDSHEPYHWAKKTVATNPDAVKRRREVKTPEVEWQLSMPTDLVFDNVNRRLIVADTQRQRIQIYNKLKDYTPPSRTL